MFSACSHSFDACSSMIDPVYEQEMITSDLCEEEQSELVDSKEHLKDLCKDHKLKINKYSSGDGLGQVVICDHKQQLTDLDTKITKCIDQNNETHSKLDGFRKTLDLLLGKIGIEEGILPYDDDNNTVRKDDLKSSSSGVSSKFDLVDSKITKCIASNKLTHLKIDNLQKSLDMILKNLDSDLMVSETSASEPLLANQNEEEQVFRFPISSVNDLNMLEQELQHNEILMSNLVAKFTKIGRDFGNKCVKKIAVKIMERIISARLLTQFTWTGRTNGTNNIKLPFITYSSIFSLCLQVISRFDPSFDSNACQNFLKNNILKHSSMRLSRKFNKKVNRSRSIDETWCMRSKRSLSLQSSVPEQKSDTEEDGAFVEEEDTVDSKANILNLLDAQKETNNNPEVFEEKAEEETNHCFSPNSFPKKCDHESKLDKMDRKISQCLESNTKVHSKIDNMQETLNVILNKIGNCKGFVADTAYCATPAPPVAPADFEMTENELESFYFPITTISDLNDLNIKLSISEEFEEKMINKFFIAAGNSKKLSTQRFGLEVVESVISLQLLMKYSWTGRSKSVEPKFAFMKYQYIVNFFQKTISKVDKRFTQKECEYFLRFTVFKYINMRVARQRRKIKDPVVDYLSDQDVNHEEFDNTNFSIEDADVPLSSNRKEELYEYRHDSVADFPEADEES